MAKKQLLEDIKAKPARFYRLPADVMRDRRFSDIERLEILRAWLADAASLTPSMAPSLAPSLAPQIESAIGELQSRLPASGRAAE